MLFLIEHDLWMRIPQNYIAENQEVQNKNFRNLLFFEKNWRKGKNKYIATT